MATTFVADVRQLLGIPASAAAPEVLTQENAQLRALAAAHGKLSSGAEGLALTSQWLTVSRRIREACSSSSAADNNNNEVVKKEAGAALRMLNEALRLTVFATASAAPTLADAALFLSVGPFLAAGGGPASLEGLPNVARWYAHVATALKAPPAFASPFKPLSLEEAQKASAPVALPAVVAASFGAGGDSDAAAPALPAAKGAASNNKNKNKNNNNNNNNNNKKQQKQKGKKGNNKAPKAKGGAAAASDVEAIAEVDLRVGHIVKAWEHPDSDKLWCEEVDCGEAKPRQILSGLRHFFPTVEQMQGRKVVVVCNLKAAKLGGIPSHGMVLCASNADHTQVQFLTPPEGAKVGERVTFVGLDNATPATGSRMNKKKIFDAAAKELKTTAECVAAHAGRHMVTSAGAVTVESLKESFIK